MCKHTTFFEKIIFQYHPEYQSADVRRLARKNPTHFNIERLIEETFAFVGGYNFVNENGRDFDDVDNSDSKTTTVGATRIFEIGSVESKIGSLRVVVYDPIVENLAFLYIPKKDVPSLVITCGKRARASKLRISGRWNAHADTMNKMEIYRLPTFKHLALASDKAR